MNKNQFYFAFLTLANHRPFTTKSNISTYKPVLDRALELGLVELNIDSTNNKHSIYRLTELGRTTITKLEGHLSL